MYKDLLNLNRRIKTIRLGVIITYINDLYNIILYVIIGIKLAIERATKNIKKSLTNIAIKSRIVSVI